MPLDLPTLELQMRAARTELRQAVSAYVAAMDLLARAKAAQDRAASTADQALAAKIAATQKVADLFATFQDTSDITTP
jgi:hypothetical protein